MAGVISLVQAQAQLNAWLAASLAVAGGKSYKLGNGLMVAREDIGEIQKQIAYWTRVVQRLSPRSQGGRRMGNRYWPIDL